MSIFRRSGREATYVWAVSLDGSPVGLRVAERDGVTLVRANQTTVAVDFANAAVNLRRIRPR
jgi:hypothetical protein